MKKKLLLIALMVVLFACILTISICAKDVSTGYFDLEENEIIVPTYDSEGNSLVWVRSTMLNRAEQYGMALANGKNYYEISDNGTTYYIFGQKSKEAFVVDNNYTLGIVKSRGVSSDTILVANFDGLVHKNGTGAQQFGFLMRNNIIKYVYIQSSFISTKNPNDSNKQVFLGAANLSQVEFELGSQMTELGPAAFQGCALTEVVLPECLTYIDERAFDACTSLKKIYIPRTVTFIDEIAFRGVNDAEYYFTGTEETTSGWEITNEITYVNHCDVYYGGEHVYEDDGDCTTALECERCLSVIEAAADVHDNQIVVEYANGFMSVGVKKDGCVKCSAYVTETIEPLFTCLGYSAPENGDDGISIKYTVNGTAIAEYERVTGATLSYGMFATTKQAVGNGDIFDADGNTVNGAIALDVTKSGFTFIALKMVGFDKENSKEAFFAIGAYAITTLEGEKSYSYLQEGTPLEGEKYAFIKYNDFVK